MADERTFESELPKLFAWVADQDSGLFAEGFELTLRNCFLGAFEADRTLPHPKSKDNVFMVKLADQAAALARSIEALTKPGICHPHLALKFMGAAWGINHISPQQTALLDTLDNIEKSARKSTIGSANGAPLKTGKRRIVEKGFEFFLAFGTRKPTENPDGAFSIFCREFYHRATGIDLDARRNDSEPGIARQIKDVMKLNRGKIAAKFG
ncbi:hypothetical protein FJ960_00525 [Mesorhizobium sp. B2-3-11]|uniref:hypothetical protein n=1 Tax=Mesorhizobium sp. B2-3-11 TaxID=2589953 RepID=UPI00112C3716|nr:hypothetical protein [Mesorhizobium sp. B2-3-11]TPM11277.1 hypothetical protein FJ960_00525 [Mesorhizobium sp. B2-3-11]